MTRTAVTAPEKLRLRTLLDHFAVAKVSREPWLVAYPLSEVVCSTKKLIRFRLEGTSNAATTSIQGIFRVMASDEARNSLIFDDILQPLEAGRSPVVLTERTAHLESMAARL